MSELDELVRIATETCAIIRRHYATEIHVDYKIGDDPVTGADREANDFICTELQRAFPGIPIVAEESDPRSFDSRRTASECFFVDPLDGTREFVARNGEFAVMIGLARGGRAELGVVASPVTERTWLGGPGGSFEVARDGSRKRIAADATADVKRARALVSRSRATDAMFATLARMGVTHIAKMGSAGLKSAEIARGAADLWVQIGPSGMLWDACGPEAIIRGAGGFYGQRGGVDVDYTAGAIDLDGIVVAANDTLFHAAVAAMKL